MLQVAGRGHMPSSCVFAVVGGMPVPLHNFCALTHAGSDAICTIGALAARQFVYVYVSL